MLYQDKGAIMSVTRQFSNYLEITVPPCPNPFPTRPNAPKPKKFQTVLSTVIFLLPSIQYCGLRDVYDSGKVGAFNKSGGRNVDPTFYKHVIYRNSRISLPYLKASRFLGQGTQQLGVPAACLQMLSRKMSLNLVANSFARK